MRGPRGAGAAERSGISVQEQPFVPTPSLTIERFSDVIALPGKYCLYDRDGARIDSSMTWTSSRRLGPAPEHIDVPRDLERLEGPVTFGGLFPKPHFGHVLLEMFARLWAHDARPDEAPAPLVRFTHRQRALEPFERLVLAAAFAKASPLHVTVGRPTRIDEVAVPHQAVVLGQQMLPVVLPLYDRIRENLSGPTRTDDRPLYLSRTQLRDTRRRTLGEQALEERLRRRGVRIVHPETLRLEEQIGLVAGAPTVIGLPGSALHLTIFRALRGARTISLGTRTPFATQQHVDVLRGSEFVHVRAQYPIHPRVPGRSARPVGPFRDLINPRTAERRLARLL